MPGGGKHGATAALSAVLLLAAAVGAGPGEKTLVLRDGRTARPERALHDVRRVALAVGKGRCDVRVDFARPLEEGIFECIHLFLDCDNSRMTGRPPPLDPRLPLPAGCDLWIRAAVGSRFRPNRAPAIGDLPAPFLLRRASYSYIYRQKVARRSAPAPTWLHAGRLPPPEVEGKTLRFSFPLTLLAKHGLRYNDRVPFVAFAEGLIAESPLSLEYVCEDEGAPVKVDGDPREWAPRPRARDATGELHPAAAAVDLLDLSVDHDAQRILALVRFAGAGFGHGTFDDDVMDGDAVYLALEPLGAQAYTTYVQRRVFTTSLGTPGRAAVGDRVVEWALPRRKEQTRFRVITWSEAQRWDRIPDGSGRAVLHVPREAWKK